MKDSPGGQSSDAIIRIETRLPGCDVGLSRLELEATRPASGAR